MLCILGMHWERVVQVEEELVTGPVGPVGLLLLGIVEAGKLVGAEDAGAVKQDMGLEGRQQDTAAQVPSPFYPSF